MQIPKNELARMIDATNVKATATNSDIEKLCKEAGQYGFRCAVVNPVYVKHAASLLKGSEVKALEAIKAVEDGAEELDMVMNLGMLKSGDYDAVKQDITAVLDAKRVSKELIVKVIIEAPQLTRAEKIRACEIVKEAGADFVKTSTGLFGGGATVEDVKLMRRTVGKNVGVKAAGGIRTYADAVAMIEAGANRIGTSTAIQIILDAP